MAQQTERDKLIEAQKRYEEKKRREGTGIYGKGGPPPTTFQSGDLSDLVAASRAARLLPSRPVTGIGSLVNPPSSALQALLAALRQEQ